MNDESRNFEYSSERSDFSELHEFSLSDEERFRRLAREEACPEQIASLRRMTPEQRWEGAHRLYWTMRRHKTAFLQSQHPDWTEQQVSAEVRRIFSNART